VSRRFEFGRGFGDRAFVRDFELHAHLGNGTILRPGRGAEAGLGGLRKWPDAEVFAPGQLFGGVVLAFGAGQWQPEGVHIKLATGRRVSGDYRHAGDEFDLHGTNIKGDPGRMQAKMAAPGA